MFECFCSCLQKFPICCWEWHIPFFRQEDNWSSWITGLLGKWSKEKLVFKKSVLMTNSPKNCQKDQLSKRLVVKKTSCQKDQLSKRPVIEKTSCQKDQLPKKPVVFLSSQNPFDLIVISTYFFVSEKVI